MSVYPIFGYDDAHGRFSLQPGEDGCYDKQQMSKFLNACVNKGFDVNAGQSFDLIRDFVVEDGAGRGDLLTVISSFCSEDYGLPANNFVCSSVHVNGLRVKGRKPSVVDFLSKYGDDARFRPVSYEDLWNLYPADQDFLDVCKNSRFPRQYDNQGHYIGDDDPRYGKDMDFPFELIFDEPVNADDSVSLDALSSVYHYMASDKNASREKPLDRIDIQSGDRTFTLVRQPDITGVVNVYENGKLALGYMQKDGVLYSYGHEAGWDLGYYPNCTVAEHEARVLWGLPSAVFGHGDFSFMRILPPSMVKLEEYDRSLSQNRLFALESDTIYVNGVGMHYTHTMDRWFELGCGGIFDGDVLQTSYPRRQYAYAEDDFSDIHKISIVYDPALPSDEKFSLSSRLEDIGQLCGCGKFEPIEYSYIRDSSDLPNLPRNELLCIKFEDRLKYPHFANPGSARWSDRNHVYASVFKNFGGELVRDGYDLPVKDLPNFKRVEYIPRSSSERQGVKRPYAVESDIGGRPIVILCEKYDDDNEFFEKSEFEEDMIYD